MNSVAAKLHVWLTFLLNVSKSDVLHSQFHKAGRTIPRIILRWFSSIPASFMPLVDDGHTAWIHCFWNSNQFHRLYRWFPNAYAKLDNRDCAVQPHPLTPSVFDNFVVKTLATFVVKKQQSQIYRNDVGTLRQHIEFSRRFYIVTNNAGKVDLNCEL